MQLNDKDKLIYVKAKLDVLNLIHTAAQDVVDYKSEVFMLGGIAGLKEAIEIMEIKK